MRPLHRCCKVGNSFGEQEIECRKSIGDCPAERDVMIGSDDEAVTRLKLEHIGPHRTIARSNHRRGADGRRWCLGIVAHKQCRLRRMDQVECGRTVAKPSMGESSSGPRAWNVIAGWFAQRCTFRAVGQHKRAFVGVPKLGPRDRNGLPG